MKPSRPVAVRPLLAAASLACLALVGGPAPCRAAGEVAAYHQLQEWRYQAAASPVPAGGVTIEREGATWALESGTIRLAEPTPEGAVTGLVFEGAGRFHFAVSDPVERQQLARRAGGRTELDLAFSRLVLRAPGGVAELAGLPAPSAPYEKSDLAAKRHEDWLEHRSFDADARIAGGAPDAGQRLPAGRRRHRRARLAHLGARPGPLRGGRARALRGRHRRDLGLGAAGRAAGRTGAGRCG